MTESTKPRVPQFTPALWTTIKINPSRTFEDENTEDGKMWLSIIRLLTRDRQPGFLHGIWGRVKESPETVWLVTGWLWPESLDEFEKSSDYVTYCEKLASLTSSPPVSVHCHFSGFFWDQLTENTGITDLSFPLFMTSETRDTISRVHSISYFANSGKGLPRSTNGRGIKGWVQENIQQDDREVVVMRYIDNWLTEDAERKFKREFTAMLALKEGDIVENYFRQELEEAGMVGIKQQHCKFSHIPQMF